MRQKITILFLLSLIGVLGVKAQSSRCVNPDSIYIGGTVTALCPGQSTTLLVNGMTTTSTYNWSTGSTSPFVLINAPGLVWCIVTDVNQCVSDTAFYNLAAGTPTNADFTYVDNGGTVTFTDASTGGPSTWAWDFGDGNTASVQNPTHSFVSAGSFFVCLTAGGGPCGPTTWCDTVVVTFVGNEEMVPAGKMLAWPNPASDLINLEYAVNPGGELSLEIYAVTGQKVMDRSWGNTPQGSIQLPLHHLANGIYVARLSHATQSWTQRIEVRR
ncbi:MAG: T9SS type A sorting domain-containing protein [Bacteroidia bacterium]|nr:T9SS type A sorting domain-containing protein [Bacteroidia bacterium]